MANLRFPALVAAATALAALGLSDPAQGAGRVLAQSGTGIEPVNVRVAESVAPGWSTFWVSVRVDGGAGRFALVVPVPPGTAVDPSIDAWLEALDEATAPRIRPPKGILACGATTYTSLENTSALHVTGLPPTQVAVLSSVAQVSSFAQGQGLDFSAEDATELSKHPGLAFVGVVYDVTGASATTETLRFTLPSGTPELAFGLVGAAAELTLWTIGEGRARVNGAEEIESGDLGVTWAALQGASNYGAQRQQTLTQKMGGAWLLESTGSTPLFASNVLPSGLGTIAPAVSEYFDRAHAQGANVGATAECLAPVWESRSQGELGARVGRACAPGLLAQVPGGPGACNETPGAGEISAAPLRCGDADDLAFALSGLLASDAKLTRQTSIVGVQTPPSTPIAIQNGPSVSLLVTADDADTTGCLLGGSGGGGGYGGGPDQPPYTGGYGGDGVVVVEQPPQTQVDVSCWGSSSSNGGDSCGGDSTSSSDQGDTCSGDSNSSSEGDTCSGDSSSSNSEGDTCSGDSGSSSSSGDTCGGSSDSGGDTCSGSSSSGSSDCSVGPVRPRRLRVSALTLLLVALALPARRRWRRRRPAPPRC